MYVVSGLGAPSGHMTRTNYLPGIALGQSSQPPHSYPGQSTQPPHSYPGQSTQPPHSYGHQASAPALIPQGKVALKHYHLYFVHVERALIRDLSFTCLVKFAI